MECGKLTSSFETENKVCLGSEVECVRSVKKSVRLYTEDAWASILDGSACQ